MIGHGCSPYFGSEPGLTWNWAYHMSAENTVHLVSFPEHRRDVERFLAENPRSGLRLHWVTINRHVDPWKPERGQKGISRHYLIWIRRVLQYARVLQKSERFDVIHHVGWGTVSIPSPFWRLNTPLIWGPLGGGQTCAPGLLPMFGTPGCWEALRTFRIRTLPFLPSFRTAARRSFAAPATNKETESVLRKGGATNVPLLMDSALRTDFIPHAIPSRQTSKSLSLIWAGRLLRWKGLDLAILALRQLGTAARVRLVVAGTGPLEIEFRDKVRRLGLDAVITVRGRIPWADMPREFEAADALLFTSTRESLGSVVLEAAAYGLPYITLDSGGPGTFFPSSAGIKIRPTTLEGTAKAISDAIVELRDHPERRIEMGSCAYRFAKENVWEAHARIMQRIYEDAVRSRNPGEPQFALKHPR